MNTIRRAISPYEHVLADLQLAKDVSLICLINGGYIEFLTCGLVMSKNRE